MSPRSSDTAPPAMYSSEASDFYENKKRKLELRDDVCFVLSSLIPMFAWRSASAFHSFIQKQERAISRALSSTIETNASFLLLFSFNLMKATVAVVACLTKAYTSGQYLQITSTMVRRISDLTNIYDAKQSASLYKTINALHTRRTWLISKELKFSFSCLTSLHSSIMFGCFTCQTPFTYLG